MSPRACTQHPFYQPVHVQTHPFSVKYAVAHSLIATIRNTDLGRHLDGCILMRMLTLRQLRYLDALARHEHFGRAAEECAVSQPALSMQIRELERELGAELVERRQGAIGLTQVGAEVARRAGAILSATSDLADCGTAPPTS